MPIALQQLIAGTRGRTTEALTIPVDYNDGTAVDPPDYQVFTTQQEIDDFLAANSTSNFKHLQLAYNALPPFVEHAITFNLAAGVHRPVPFSIQGTFEAWRFTTKNVSVSGGITIIGATATSWDVQSSLSALLVDSHQDASNDPWIDVSSTNPLAFAGLDLKGFFAVTSEGNKYVIHDHTDDRLFLTANLAGLIDGVSTVSVMRPSTILRNSQDDLVNDATSTTGVMTAGTTWFENITIEKFGGTASNIGITSNGASVIFTYSIIDEITPSLPPFNRAANGYGFSLGGQTTLSYTAVSFAVYRAPPTGADRAISSFSPGSIFLNRCYLRGGGQGIVVLGGSVRFYGPVIEDMGSVTGHAVEITNAMLTLQNIGGRGSLIRDITGTGLELRNNFAVAFETLLATFIEFANISGPCVKFYSNNALNFLLDPGFIDGGGNGDVGIEIAGSGNNVVIPAASDVTGANGDVRVGTAIISYSEIAGLGPLQLNGPNTLEQL